MVVTGPDSIEDSGVDPDPQGSASVLLDGHPSIKERTFSPDQQLDDGSVDELLVLNHVDRHHVIDRDDGVPWRKAGYRRG